MAAPMKSCLVTVSRAFTRYSSVRWYSKNMKRSIQNVHTPEEDMQRTKNVKSLTNPRQNPFVQFVPTDPVQKSISELAVRRDKAKSANKSKHKVNSRKSVSKVLTTSNGLNYEVLEEEDRRFGRVLLQAKQKKSREELNQVVLEGKNLIRDAIAAGVRLISLYFSRVEVLEGLPEERLREASLYQVQYRHLQLWSDVDTPQGLIGLFEMPPNGEALQPAAGALPLTLICDSIREPGNLGTLLRSAAAVGCKQVIATKGCVDIWNSKVLRSAAGCHFRVPIIRDVTWPQIPGFLESPDSLNVVIADCSHPTDSRVNQLAGSPDVTPRIEAVREQEMISENAAQTKAIDQDETESDWSSVDRDIDEDDSYRDRNVLSLYREAPLNVSLYDSVDYTGSHAVIVISGETSGVSAAARKLAYDHYGQCVMIPMATGVDSLNCAVAGSVILYEAGKQFRKLRSD